MPAAEYSHSTHHKEAFRHTWTKSAIKEARIKHLIESWTPIPVREVGFGAGSTEYIPGTSAKAGHEKSAPDFALGDTPIRIEVTGPLATIPESCDLLVNQHKVRYAQNHPELEYWVAHVNGIMPDAAIRIIRVGNLFAAGIANGTIIREQAVHHGVSMLFWAIPPDHPCVCSVKTFRRYIREYRDFSSPPYNEIVP